MKFVYIELEFLLSKQLGSEIFSVDPEYKTKNPIFQKIAKTTFSQKNCHEFIGAIWGGALSA